MGNLPFYIDPPPIPGVTGVVIAMPQANARIWDEKGNVVIGEDEGISLP